MACTARAAPPGTSSSATQRPLDGRNEYARGTLAVAEGATGSPVLDTFSFSAAWRPDGSGGVLLDHRS